VARQVLTLPDVPSTLLTKSAADGYYLPLSHEPGTDPHAQYLNTSRGDGRYSLLAHDHAGVYSPAAHNHDAAYSPLGHLHTVTYVDAAGDSMAGALTITAAGTGLYLNRADAPSYLPYQEFQRQGAPKWSLGLGPGDEFFLYNSDLSRAPINVYPSGTVVLSANDTNTTGLRVGAVRSSFGSAVFPPGNSHPGNTIVTIGTTGILEANTSGSYVAIADNYYWSDANAARTILNAPGSYLQQYSGNLMFANVVASAPGTNVSAVNRFHIQPHGTASFVSDGATMAIEAYNNIRLRAGPSNLAGYWLTSNDGVDRAFIGLESASTTLWRLYSPLQANIFSIDLTNGVASFKSGAIFGGNVTVTSGFYRVSSGGAYTDVNHTGVNTVGGNLYLNSNNNNIQMQAPGSYIHPHGDNITHFGHPGIRFVAFYATNGSIQTSHVTAKQGFAPLDPGACAAAVLGTDWLDFEYVPPPIREPEARGLESAEERRDRYVNHARVLEETAPARKQRGYVLESPQHKVSPLFGLSDRKSSSPSSDLAVVACALQFALREIEQLKTELASRG
jgi:hypothetical protein